ncbi:MAG TPA: GatB/YqeY domain-containing protein [candidate division Zixibacteria bacterium]|nr:GatB/YqeY domain-containing protein [candidate division Zixibacteria bacterium]HER00558.1 GatB/YqeY domain-containing protein [candidate division Zixibacteria bacterium]
MTISQRIESDIKEAMKAREAQKLSYLRNFKSALKYKEIDKKDKLTEEEEIQVLSSLVKQLRDSLEQAEKAGREDHASRAKDELDLAMTYMPEQMSEEEIEKLAHEVIEEVDAKGPSDMGIVMKGLMPKVKGKADGSVVKAVVMRLLKG